MKSLWISLALIAAFSVAGNLPISAQSPEQLYQKGLMKEEGEGNLQDAIAFYNQIADNREADQSLRAKALLHIGLCYEKMGTQEAVKSYQRLVTSFPNQTNEVAIAKERLNRLLVVADKVPANLPALKFTKLEIPTKPGNGILSPDGRKLVYIADNALWSVPVQGRTKSDIAGEPTRLTETMGAWDLANMGTVWSSDGMWLAFYGTENREDVIYIVSAKGGKPVKVPLDHTRLDIRGYDYRMSLSPDGKMLAFVNRDENKNTSIYTISTQGGLQNKLTGSGTREPAFSPDGKFIAYVKTSMGSSLGDEIWLIPSSGGQPVMISDDADVVKSPIWSPDASMIAFLARKYEKGWANNSNELWIAAVDRGGKPTGLITKTALSNSTSSMLAGWDADNKIGIWLSEPDKNYLYTVPSTGGQAMQVTSENSWMPCWSPDSKYLYFDGIHTDKYAGLESVSANGGDVQRIPIRSKEAIQPEMPTGGISVSPDGQEIVFATYYTDNQDTSLQKKPQAFHHIVIIPVKGGSPVQLATNPFSDLFDGYPVWSPNGRKIAFLRQENKTKNNGVESFTNIYIIPADGGKPEKISSETDAVTYGRIDWSPDGKWIGFFSYDSTIKMIPVGGGNSKVIVKNVEFHSHFGLSFSPEGDKIVYSNKEKIFVVDLNTGKREEIRTGLDAIPTMPAWSRDGKKIAFCAYDEGETDLWFMENFLPLEQLPQFEEQKELLIRKILADTESEPLGTPSPDGRYISYTDWNSDSNLGILDLETKEKKILTDYKDPNEQVYYSRWSPDGKQIAYFWWKYDEDQYNLSVVDVKTAESRDLFISDRNDWIELGNWSSDGKYIFATLSLRDEPKCQLARFSATDGKMKVLRTFEESYTGGKPYVSPDNRYVAFDVPDRNASGNSDIFLLSLENGQENALIRHLSHDYIFGWSPDGKSILFATDRSGTVDAMLLAVKEGKPAGTPKPVKQNIGLIVPMGITQDGSFFYGQWPGANNIFSAEINIDEGKIISKPDLLVQKFEGRNYSPAYSLNGNYLAYISERGVMNRGELGPVLCIRNLETGEELEVNPDLQIAGHDSNLKWSPDNHSLALACENQEGHARIYKYDIQSRQFSPLALDSEGQTSETEFAYPVWSKDGNFIFYLQLSRYSETSRIMERNISTGTDKELYSYTSEDFMDRMFNISLSPDGKWLAAINRGENRVVRLISTNDGNIRELSRFNSPGGDPYAPVWSNDGKYLAIPFLTIQVSSNVSREWGVMRIPVEGGESLFIEMNINGVGSPSLHPDGRTLAFRSAGYSFPENNIWEMKYFLPSEKELENMAAEPEGIRIKKVWESSYLEDLGRVSYDGRFRSCVDWGVGDLAIHDLKSGQISQLTHTASLGDSGSFVLNTAISKNGKQIVSTWWRPYNTTDMVLYDVENSTSKMLYSKQGEEVYPYSWLSDHEFIGLRLIPEGRTLQIVSYNIPDKSLQVKKSFNKIQGIHLTCSPDELYIAYDFDSGDDSENLDINILSVDGNSDIPLINHPANDRVFGWVPGSKEFLFLSDRSGNWDLWAVTLDDNQVAGPAKRIFADIGEVEPMGYTQNGDYYFGFSKRNFYTSITPFNPTTGEIEMGSGKSLKGSNYGVIWSPHGLNLAYIKIDDGNANHPVKLIVQDLESGVEVEPLSDTFFPGTYSWSPDGKSLLVVGRDKKKLQTKGYQGEFFLMDLETGQTDQILQLSDYEFNVPEDDAAPLSRLEWSPDGRSFYFLFFKDRLMKHNLDTGEDKILFRYPNFTYGVLDLSPDGKSLLIGLEYPGDEKSRLFILPAEGGEEKEVCTSQESKRFNKAFWSPDGKYIYFVEMLEDMKTNLWRISSTGGKPEKVWSSENRVEIFDVHPKGNQIAFSIRERRTEVRVIENLTNEIAKVFNGNE